MNFIVAADDESDIWHDIPTKSGITMANYKKMKKRAPTLSQQQKAEKAEKVREYNHGMAWMMKLQWSCIPPEGMAMFVVQRKRQVPDKATGALGEKWCPYTYLAIIIDETEQPPVLSSENMANRCDVLTDALCRAGNVQQGYSILLYGTRLEFYRFDAGPRYKPLETDYSQEELAEFEPRMWLLENEVGPMELHLREARWESVDSAFKSVIVLEVWFKDSGSDDVWEQGVEGATG